MSSFAFLLNDLIPALQPQSVLRQALSQGWETDHWIDKANSFCWLAGPSPSYGHLLMRWEDISTISIEATVSLTIKSISNANDSTDQTNSILLENLYIKSIKTLYASNSTNRNNDICLLSLVDKRHIFSMSHVGKSYNVPSPASITSDITSANYYDSESLNGGALWTWNTLFQDLWALLPGGGSPPTLPYTAPATPDTAFNEKPFNFQFWGISVWEAIFIILNKLSCSVKLDHVTNTYTVFKEGDTQNLSSVLSTLNDTVSLASYNPRVSNATRVPHVIKVYFPRVPKHYGTSQQLTRTGNQRQKIFHGVDVSTGVAGAVVGTYYTIYDDKEAIEGFDGSITNNPALADRATEVAGQLATRLQQATAQRRSFLGLVTSVPVGSEIQCVRWQDLASAPGLVTQIEQTVEYTEGHDKADLFKSPPPNLEHQSPRENFGSTTGSPVADLPSANRFTYPHPVQLLKIDDGASSTGSSISPTGNGLFPGKVLRADPETSFTSPAYSNETSCWIAFVDLNGGSSSASCTAIQGDRYLGKLNGVAVVSADTRPLFLVRLSGTPTVRKWKNVSGETAPARCYVEIFGSEIEDGELHLLGVQPGNGGNYFSLELDYAINSDMDVDADAVGDLQIGPDMLALAEGEIFSSPPLAGQCYGPKPGQWAGSQYYPGFFSRGIVSIDNVDYACVRDWPFSNLVGKATSNIAVHTVTTEYQMWIGPIDAQFVTTWVMPPAKNETDIAISTGDWIKINICGDQIYLEPWNC